MATSLSDDYTTWRSDFGRCHSKCHMAGYNVKVALIISSSENNPADKRKQANWKSFISVFSPTTESPDEIPSSWTIGSYWTHAGKATPKASQNRGFPWGAGSGLIASEWVARLKWKWLILCIWTHQTHFQFSFRVTFCILCHSLSVSRNEERRECLFEKKKKDKHRQSNPRTRVQRMNESWIMCFLPQRLLNNGDSLII